MPESETFRAVMNGDLDIRHLAREDLPQVLEIERQSYSHPWAEAVFQDCFRDNYRLWAACQGDVLIGYAVVAYMVDEAHLLNLCVHPGRQGQGLGRQLLRHLLAEAGREQIRQTILEVRLSNDAAHQLYLAEGFDEIGRRPGYYPDAEGREDARVMAFRFSA
ncbi:ribosomal protein S18-alanine N-acetyltransferase [Marinobacter arenosus]|uniref:ribosomal protein S18-alanine N-acetyltransferase n=1 Tax=Marinobacter arenosus TaxID=2856822 RepID=UPI001C4A928D|nr:ribosomal protein S18-alanine N-acetyltransferase [Marinobacter arenosus]MBW0148701.1 ribosomal protein S18-alanine N-acetyltransferase [Marinobacter arenosus]